MQWLEQVDPEVAKAIRLETERLDRALQGRADAKVEASVRAGVASLTGPPLYPERLA